MELFRSLTKAMRWLLPWLALLVASCSGKKPAPAEVASDPHEEAIREFISAPRRFHEVVATIRDEASYDRAAPGLEEVVQKFRGSAMAFRKLDPPAEPEQAKYRQMIADGFRGTEPTGEDMLSLISIESRETEVTKWLEEFMASGREAGTEAVRLYGDIRLPGADAGNAEIERVKAQMEDQAKAGIQRALENMEKEAAKMQSAPAGSEGNPLFQHLANPEAEAR